MARLTKKQEKSVLDGLTLMDDALFTMCFDGSAECGHAVFGLFFVMQTAVRDGGEKQPIHFGHFVFSDV